MPNPLDPRPKKRGRPAGSKNKPSLGKLSFDSSKKVRKPHAGLFKKGWKGGPGRPHGSRNRASIIIEQIGEKIARENAERVYNHMLALALGETDKGDIAACKYIYETACPPRKGARVDLCYEEDLREARTSKEVDELSRKVTQDSLEGSISIEEADGWGKVLEHRLKILTDVDVLKKIEETCKKVDSIYTEQ